MVGKRKGCSRINEDDNDDKSIDELFGPGLLVKLEKLFHEYDYYWTLDTGEVIIPDTEDFEAFLDEAVRLLHKEEIGTRLTVGRLIIEKQENKRYDVYVYVGDFE